jgi:hypothetical protein
VVVAAAVVVVSAAVVVGARVVTVVEGAVRAVLSSPPVSFMTMSTNPIATRTPRPAAKKPVTLLLITPPRRVEPTIRRGEGIETKPR